MWHKESEDLFTVMVGKSSSGEDYIRAEVFLTEGVWTWGVYFCTDAHSYARCIIAEGGCPKQYDAKHAALSAIGKYIETVANEMTRLWKDLLSPAAAAMHQRWAIARSNKSEQVSPTALAMARRYV